MGTPQAIDVLRVDSIAGLDSVYDVLVQIAGADETMRGSFIQNHLSGCEEWRFCGRLGFGGKYRSRTNTVDCYREDETKTRRVIIKATNAELVKLSNDPSSPAKAGQ